jgi:hypothetical protein
VTSSGGNITAGVAGVSNVMVLSNTIANYSGMTAGLIFPTGTLHNVQQIQLLLEQQDGTQL